MMFHSSGKIHSDSELENLKYKRKLKKMKKLLKDMIYENAAVCDVVCEVEKRYNVVQQENKYLLLKLFQFDPTLDPKFLKKKTTPAKCRKKTPSVALDGNGQVIFPITLGFLKVYSFGEFVSDRLSFHTESAFFPVGYLATRVYGSIKDPEKRCVYTCRIYDGGFSPIFEIAAETNLDTPLSGSSADEVHGKLLELINNALGEQVVSTHANGLVFFGLTHPIVLNLLQNLPNAKKCVNFKHVAFGADATVEENDARINFDSLQRSISFGKYNSNMDIKEEPDDSC